MEAEHTEDDDDDDFNPNEFIDDLLDLNKDEIGNGIISKREARELQYDAYDMLFPQERLFLRVESSAWINLRTINITQNLINKH